MPVDSIFFCSLAEHLRSLTDTGMRKRSKCCPMHMCIPWWTNFYVPHRYINYYVSQTAHLSLLLTNISLKKRNSSSPSLLRHTLLSFGWNESHPQHMEERSTAGWTQEEGILHKSCKRNKEDRSMMKQSCWGYLASVVAGCNYSWDQRNPCPQGYGWSPTMIRVTLKAGLTGFFFNLLSCSSKECVGLPSQQKRLEALSALRLSHLTPNKTILSSLILSHFNHEGWNFLYWVSA